MMSYDPFECKTFSKRMGEDSEGENSEEDFDEMIMNTDYFQKQNKSSEPSVVCDPLMLDPTNMNENTIMLIRRIEENLSKKKDGEKLKTKSDTYSLPQSTGQCNESAPISNTNSKECIKVQQKGKREISQLISDIENEQSSVKRVCRRKRVKTKKSSKSFWSPGNVHTLSSKGTKSNPEEPSDNPAETIVNLQDPAVIEMNTNELLRSIAKDIEEYKKSELTKPPNTPNNVNKIEEHTGNSNKQQEKSLGKPSIEIANPKNPTPKNSGIKCYHCDSRFQTIQLVINHSRTVHHKINELSKQKKSTEKLVIKTPTLEKPTGINNLVNNPLKCNCNLNFQTIKLLKLHLKTANCTFDKLICDICKRKYWYHESLVVHKNTKHGALNSIDFKCKICYRTFSHHIDLLSHKEVAHGDKTLLKNKVAMQIAKTEAKYGRKQDSENN